eukprot:comp16995_c0_seq1/m.15665 comp16995_c0_seq1/g.15665  ORF comp16995_c0_seq1/g.15665 comp16995_c0_seq1/m.15665 type:complete len:209 (-) comp16995_c0_seq1:565-1191(-)
MSWEDDDFEPQVPKRTAQIGFEDEDEDEDDVKDDWDADSEEEEGTPSQKAATPEPGATAAAQPKKKSLKQVLKEKEQQKESNPADDVGLNAKKDVPARRKAGGEFAALQPKSKEEFAELAKLVAKRLSSLQSTPFYSFTIETILREATANASVDDVKKIVSMLNNIANDKQKAEKGKVKPKKGKATLKMEARGDRDYTEDAGDDDDDY